MSKGGKVYCLSHLLLPYSDAHRTDCDMQQTSLFSMRCASNPGIQDYDMQQTTLFLTADVHQNLEILNCDMQHDIKVSWDDI
jgi:hypothetical protein